MGWCAQWKERGAQGLGSPGPTELKSWLCVTLEDYLTSLCLGFLICKISLKKKKKTYFRDFPGGPVVKNQPQKKQKKRISLTKQGMQV